MATKSLQVTKIQYKYTGDTQPFYESLLTRDMAVESGMRELLNDAVNVYVLDGTGIRFGGRNASEVIVGTEGDDAINGSGGRDAILGSGGNDSLSGGRGNDILFGDDGNDILNGGGGGDILVGGLGVNTLDGGKGNDTAVYLGTIEDYDIQIYEAGLSVTSLGSADIDDFLTNIEYLQFGYDVYSVEALAQDAALNVTDPVVTDPIGDPNEAPVAVDDSFAGVEDAPVQGFVLGNDTDADGNTLVVVPVSGGTSSGGEFSMTADGGFIYTPALHFSGTDSFNYTVSDGNGGTDTGTVTVQVAGVADAPTLGASDLVSATFTDDSTSILVPLTISADLVDNDGSESLSIKVSGLPVGASLTKGVLGVDGTWALSPADLQGLMIDLPPTVIDDFQLAIVVQAEEGVGGSLAVTDGVITVDVTAWAAETPTEPVVDPDPAPTTPPLLLEGEIVAIGVENNTSADVAGDYKTFGHVFVAGDLPVGQGLVAVIDGVEYQVQVDVKATYDDGSAKHAILTMVTPALVAGQSVDAILTLQDTGLTGADLTTADVFAQNYDLQVKIDLDNGDGTTTNYVIDAATWMQAAIDEGRIETWIDGPFASEFSFNAKLPGQDHLELRFDVRVYANGEIRTDVAVANESTYTAGIETFQYAATIVEGGEIVFQDLDIAHHRNSNWHTQVWSEDEPAAFITFDVDYMAATGAIPHYDTSLGVNEAVLDNGLNADFGPMGSGTIQTYMPQTGGRADIGLLSGWTARWLVSQDEDAFEVMMGNADAAGSVPWHFVDEATGTYVNVQDRPGLWIDYRQTGGTDALATSYTADKGGWTPDAAHQPALSFLPYLMTGDKYHLDNLLGQATWTIAKIDPGFRASGEGGLLVLDEGAGQQVRGSAWSLRTITDADFAVPDGHPLENYFAAATESSLSYMVKQYIIDGRFDSFGELEGFFFDMLSYSGGPDAGRTSPWMQDYLVTALGLAADRGFDKAVDLLEWSQSFFTGRFTHADEGFDPYFGSAYRLQLYTPGVEIYDTWAKVFDATFGEGAGGLTSSIADASHGTDYVASATASMATLITHTQSPDAVEAYGFLLNDAYLSGAFDASNSNGYISLPRWLLMPEMSDGSYLSHDNIHVGGSLVGSSQNEMLIGDDVSNSISGGGGIDWLFGNGGNDSLSGGAGNDLLFGGAGADTLEGGAGSDVLKGGSGADDFVYSATGFGSDTISDFDVLEDSLMLSSALGDGTLTSAEVVAAMTAVAGGVLLNLGGGDEIFLQGLLETDIGKVDFGIGG